MLITANIEEKSVGPKLLIKNTKLKLQEGEKVGFIGRNGVGKTTLLRIIDGADADYTGSIDSKPNLVMITTDQEQAARPGITVLDYVLDGLRKYRTLTRVIEEYPDIMGEDLKKISEFSDALDLYSQYGYHHVVDQVRESLRAYQLTDSQIDGEFLQLSGGQKRFAQLVQVEYSNADLLILDEPTNHMDYIAKENFITWLKQTYSSVLVISHDRDVLQAVSRIIELKDRQIHSFKGNYDAFLRQNALSNLSSMHQYEVDVKTLENRRDALRQAEIKKLRCKQSPNPFVPLVRRLQKEITELETRLAKPSIWIDQSSFGGLKKVDSERYAKYKTKNIEVRTENSASQSQLLIEIDNLSLGYDTPLFQPFSVAIRAGDKVRIIGRNGAGKTTLVDAIYATSQSHAINSKVYSGVIDCSPSLKIGRYEQEINEQYLDKTLAETITSIYRHAERQINDEILYALLNEYLFAPSDKDILVRQLSGGQKARIQLIALFVGRPNLIILDEPTNHLDLPSIEELEAALQRYQGAIVYISHDSYFASALGGEGILIGE
ncbi:ABC-F family ATP-binding cassette domain-containing protein [Candidatus Saccharibacteria bacterium]|nr:ABC-F family ATP-binding cassette domain-containing protein [Candidatus Saccharibacteria bacterium]